MSLSRSIEPELLDALTADDPRAIRARRDLRRVNTIMGHTAIWKRMIRTAVSPDRSPVVIVELGAGDGSLMLRLARTLALQWPHVRLFLVDRHPAVSDLTLSEFATLGWQTEVVKADVMDWINTMPPADLILTNLFLHHFNGPVLSGLLHKIAAKTGIFAACEPRRSSIALAGSHLLGLIGCGPVTRYDAVVSVRAGFSGTELSELWPEQNDWRLQEGKAGLFTHTFIAQRSPTSALSAQP